jgi:Domain of unknown function (DUF4129)
VILRGNASPRPLPGGRQPLLVSLRNRAAATGLVLVVVFVAVGAAAPPLTKHGPWHNLGGPVAAVLELVLGTLLLTLRSIRQHAPEPSHMTARLRLFLHRTIISTMVAVVAVVVSSLVWPSLKNYYANPISGLPYLGSGVPPTPFRQYTKGEVELAAAGLALVLIAIAVVIARLRRREAAIAVSGPAEEEDGSLRQAVESGLRALQSTEDARAAIIACYLTMEESLRNAGTARYLSETSAELLTRAVSTGLLNGPAASQLTLLFYEARFSTHELPAGARQDAVRALEAISAELQSGAGVSRPLGAAATQAAS